MHAAITVARKPATNAAPRSQNAPNQKSTRDGDAMVVPNRSANRQGAEDAQKLGWVDELFQRLCEFPFGVLGVFGGSNALSEAV
jgi:hypothetical protein